MMRYKTYEAETLQQAILKMTIDLGKDAILVSHKEVKRGGIAGLFGKKMVEVTGAVPIRERRPADLITKTYRSATQLKPSPQDVTISPLEREFKELKCKVDAVLEQLKNEDTPQSKYPGKTGDLYIRLLQSEVEENLAERLIKRLIQEVPSSSYTDRGLLVERLEQYITELFKVDGDFDFEKEPLPRAISFIGPTGVGKTTTLAKLAANFALEKGRRIGLITIDTYRIAAVEQLKTYAEILDLPLRVVFTPEDFKEALKSYTNMDLIMIDTAGRSQRNFKQIEELKNYLHPSKCYRLNTYLLLSATSKYKDMLDVVESFSRIGFDRVIFTKLDETVTFGPIVSVLNKISQPLSYVTTGQNVPEDIEVADSRKLARKILNGGIQNEG